MPSRLAKAGEAAEALLSFDRALEAAPSDLHSVGSGGWLNALVGRRGRKPTHGAPNFARRRFSSAWLAYVEIARGNRVEGTRLLERTEQLIGKSRSMIFLAELALGYARVGREADARRLNDEIHAIGARRPKEGAPTRWPPRPSATTTRCCVGSRSPTAKVRNHEVDEGFIALNNLRMNVTADPALEQPRVRAALDRIRGD